MPAGARMGIVEAIFLNSHGIHAAIGIIKAEVPSAFSSVFMLFEKAHPEVKPVIRRQSDIIAGRIITHSSEFVIAAHKTTCVNVWGAREKTGCGIVIIH